MSDATDAADSPPEALGDWRVDRNVCMGCNAPPAQAPDLMAFSERRNQCYFKRQPTTPGETERACRAAWASCCNAVQYHGTDAAIQDRIQKLERSGFPRSRKEGLLIALVGLLALTTVALWLYSR